LKLLNSMEHSLNAIRGQFSPDQFSALLNMYESADDEKYFEINDNDNYVSDENDDSDALVLAIGALRVAASAYGIYKVAPYIKKWWNDKVVLGIKKLKSKAIGETEKVKANLI